MLIRCEPRFVPFLSLLDLLNQVIVNLTKVTAIHFSYSPPLIRSHPFVPVFQEVFLEHLTKDIYTTIHSLKHNISYFHAFFRVICTGFETNKYKYQIQSTKIWNIQSTVIYAPALRREQCPAEPQTWWRLPQPWGSRRTGGRCRRACVCGRLHLLLQIIIHAATFLTWHHLVHIPEGREGPCGGERTTWVPLAGWTPPPPAKPG